MSKAIGAACAAAALLGLWATNAEAQLDGEFRLQYIASGQKGCLAKQAADPVNAGVDRDRLNAFCLCKMTYLADHVTIAELVANHKLVQVGGSVEATSPSASMLALIDRSSTYCAANYEQYIGPK